MKHLQTGSDQLSRQIPNSFISAGRANCLAKSGSVLLDPLSSLVLEALGVVSELGAGFFPKRAGGVGDLHHGHEDFKNESDLLRGLPLVLVDVCADLSLLVHVGVPDLGLEEHFRGLEGVVLELHGDLELAVLEGGLLRTDHEHVPVPGRVFRRDLEAFLRVLGQVVELLEDSLSCFRHRFDYYVLFLFSNFDFTVNYFWFWFWFCGWLL